MQRHWPPNQFIVSSQKTLRQIIILVSMFYDASELSIILYRSLLIQWVSWMEPLKPCSPFFRSGWFWFCKHILHIRYVSHELHRQLSNVITKNWALLSSWQTGKQLTYEENWLSRLRSCMINSLTEIVYICAINLFYVFCNIIIIMGRMGICFTSVATSWWGEACCLLLCFPTGTCVLCCT